MTYLYVDEDFSDDPRDRNFKICSRWLTCIHEAGHAVVAKSFGHHVNFIQVDRPYGGGRANIPDHVLGTEAGACIALAGFYAEAIFDRDSHLDKLEFDPEGDANQGDFDMCLSSKKGRTFRQIRRKTIDLLNESSIAVVQLATVLFRQDLLRMADYFVA
jgi:hypothetical protein